MQLFDTLLDILDLKEAKRLGQTPSFNKSPQDQVEQGSVFSFERGQIFPEILYGQSVCPGGYIGIVPEKIGVIFFSAGIISLFFLLLA